MKSRCSQPARTVILEILKKWERGNVFAAELIQQNLQLNPLSARDRAFVTNTVNGVIRQKQALDFLIDSFCTQKKPARGSISRQILRLSLFHLLSLKKIPAYAVLHQAGELARAHLSRPEAAYINALLRVVLSRRGRLPFPPREQKVRYLSIVHSHPSWLVARWLKRWDFKTVEEICRINNTPPPIFARINRFQASPEKGAKALRRAGVSLRPVPSYPGVWEIQGAGEIALLAPFQRGYIQVQDISSLAVVNLLSPQPGEVVVDLCAAPGSKASYIAEKMKNRGKLLAADANAKRLKLLRENFTRLGITGVTIMKVDLLQDKTQLGRGEVDKVLLDVPCSNTGVLRRRVDARWRVRPADLQRLGEQGLRLLRLAGNLLKPGGRLVYSTCSLEPEENELVVERFLEGQEEYRLLRQEFSLPRREGGDGFYAAVLGRKYVSQKEGP